jgi:hypothetical protein
MRDKYRKGGNRERKKERERKEAKKVCHRER